MLYRLYRKDSVNADERRTDIVDLAIDEQLSPAMTSSFIAHDNASRPEITASLQRGVARALVAAAQAVLFEMPLANGRRADVVALDHQGQLTIVEIKSGLADFQADEKWREYRDYCDFFTFAVSADFPDDVLPPAEGLMIADGFGGEFIRPPRHTPLSAARRKAMLIRFGRIAAGRLQSMLDPEI